MQYRIRYPNTGCYVQMVLLLFHLVNTIGLMDLTMDLQE